MGISSTTQVQSKPAFSLAQACHPVLVSPVTGHPLDSQIKNVGGHPTVVFILTSHFPSVLTFSWFHLLNISGHQAHLSILADPAQSRAPPVSWLHDSQHLGVDLPLNVMSKTRTDYFPCFLFCGSGLRLCCFILFKTGIVTMIPNTCILLLKLTKHFHIHDFWFWNSLGRELL